MKFHLSDNHYVANAVVQDVPDNAAQPAAVLSHHNEVEMELLRPPPYHGWRIVHFNHSRNTAAFPVGGQLADFLNGVIVKFSTKTIDLFLGRTELAEALVIRNMKGMQKAGRRVRCQFARLADRGNRPLGEVNCHTNLAIGNVGFLLGYQNRPRFSGEDILRCRADKQFIGKMFAVASENNQVRIAGLCRFENASFDFGDLDAGQDRYGSL